MTDGTRTRDVQDHNLALYQLSYGHRPTVNRCANFMTFTGQTVNSVLKLGVHNASVRLRHLDIPIREN